MSIRAEEAALLPFWAELTPAEQNGLIEIARRESFSPGELLYGHCRECLGTILILKGSARVCISSPEGREIMLFRLQQGDSCVLSSSCVLNVPRFDTLMTAQEDTELLVIPAEAFARMAEKNIYVKCYLYQMISLRFSQVLQVMQEMLFMGLDQRVAQYLLERISTEGKQTIEITQEKLAQEINSAREAVSRILRRFEKEGWVELGRGNVSVKETEALRQLML